MNTIGLYRIPRFPYNSYIDSRKGCSMKIQSTGAEITQSGSLFNVMIGNEVVYSNKIRMLAVNVATDSDMLKTLSKSRQPSNVYYLMKAA